MLRHFFWINKRTYILELIVTGDEQFQENEYRRTRKGYINPTLRETSMESPPLELELTGTEIAFLQDLAIKYSRYGRAYALLNETYNGSASKHRNVINKKFQSYLKDSEFNLINGRSTYKFNGEPYREASLFTILDFFDVFLSKAEKIKFDEQSYDKKSLTNEQKNEFFFQLFNSSIPCDETTLWNLYSSLVNKISGKPTGAIYSEYRRKLKDGLVDEDVFDVEYTQASGLPHNMKEIVLNALDEYINNWRASNFLFPITSETDYYSSYKEKILGIIISNNFETHIQKSWVEQIQGYSFSSTEQQEKQMLDIDDIIVSFALVALANYKFECEGESLHNMRTSYINAVDSLLKSRFNPATNEEKNNSDIKELIEIIGNMRNMIKRGSGRDELMEYVGKEIVDKIVQNTNEYSDENANSRKL